MQRKSMMEQYAAASPATAATSAGGGAGGVVDLNDLMMQAVNNTSGAAGVEAIRDTSKLVCDSSVQGKIQVYDKETGDKISQWSGTQCYLSNVSGFGPCFVVKASRHKKGDGTFFRLRAVERVLTQEKHNGKITIETPYMKRDVTILVDAKPTDFVPLSRLADSLEDRRRWSDLEKNAGLERFKRSTGRGGGRGKKSAGGGAQGETGEHEVADVSRRDIQARDAILDYNAEEEFV